MVMKIILSYIFILSFQCLGQEKGMPYDEVKVIPGLGNQWALTKEINIYSNHNLEGQVSFQIFNGKVLSIIDKSINPKLDFIRYGKPEFGANIIISSYKNGVAMVENKGRKYFLKFDPSFYSTKEYPNPVWKIYVGSEARNHFHKLMKQSSELGTILNEISKCSKRRESKCLIRALNISEEAFLKMGLAYWKNKNNHVCIDLMEKWSLRTRAGISTYPKEELGKKKEIPWSLIEALAKLNNSSIVIHNIDFEKAGEILIENIGEKFCEKKLQGKFAIKLLRNSQTNLWEIAEVYGFSESISSLRLLH